MTVEKPPIFNRTISVGNVLQIVVLLLGLATAWFAIDTRSQANEQTLQEVRENLAAIDIRLREVETEQARADERFGNILALLSRIDTRLERIEANQ